MPKACTERLYAGGEARLRGHHSAQPLQAAKLSLKDGKDLQRDCTESLVLDYMGREAT